MDARCEKCGAACCKGIITPMPSFTEDDRRWAETRGKIIGNDWCIRSVCKWLQGGKCSIYDTRPKACREFAVGGEVCQKSQVAFK